MTGLTASRGQRSPRSEPVGWSGSYAGVFVRPGPYVPSAEDFFPPKDIPGVSPVRRAPQP
jgi:hypothetical protein